MTSIPAPQDTKILECQVCELLERWRTETAPLSSSTSITGHPMYQEIIALGKPALPYLFRDLEQSQDGHLSKALSAITGAHPIPPEQRGRIALIAASWLRWARQNGYQW